MDFKFIIFLCLQARAASLFTTMFRVFTLNPVKYYAMPGSFLELVGEKPRRSAVKDCCEKTL